MRLCLKEMIPIAKKRKNGEGTLRLRKDGRWEGRIVTDYREDGRPITKNVTAKTKTECCEKLEKLKERYGRHTDKIKSDMPFGDWIDFWYQILLIGNVIEQEFTQASNWHLGSGLSIVLMVFILINMLMTAIFDKNGSSL